MRYLLPIAVVLVAAWGAAPAQEEEILERGKALYQIHCQACHGESGAGDGPAAASLRVPPTDLTGLWERYGSPLDRERLADAIDGRDLLGLHRPSGMPVWGLEFFGDQPPDTPNVEGVKRRLIHVLVDHLQTLQARQGA